MRGTLRQWLINYAAQLRFPKLLALAVGLFVFDLLVPDLLPFVDEILLALASLLLASRKKRVAPPDSRRTMEQKAK